MLPIILFLAIPILGFIVAMIDLRDWKSKLTFIVTYSLYGYATSFELRTADSFRIARSFYFGYWDFSSIIKSYSRGDIPDLYRFFVYAFVQPFTMNPKVLYAVFGLIIGIFACLSISQMYTIWKGKRTIFFYLLVFLFFLHITFFNVCTTRFFTAAALLVYSTIQFLYFRRKIALIGIFATIYIHYAFYFAVAVILFYEYILKTSRFYKYCYKFLILAFFLSLLSPQSLVDSVMGDEEVQEMTDNSSINRKIRNYSKKSKNDGPQAEKKVSSYRAANNAFKRSTQLVYTFGLIFMCYLFHRKQKQNEIVQDKNQEYFLNFVYFFLGASTIVAIFVNSAIRFRNISDMFLIFWLFSVFQQNTSVRWKDYVIMLLPVKFYYIAFFFFNAPRHCETMFWWATPISTIIDGIGFVPDFL